MCDSYKNTRVHEKLNIIWGVKLMQIKIGIYRNISSYMYVLYLQIYRSKKPQKNRHPLRHTYKPIVGKIWYIIDIKIQEASG